MNGWIRIEFQISSEYPSRAHLYFDSGQLFNEAQSIDLGPIGKQAAREFHFRLDEPVHCFRLDPIRTPGRFVIHRFRITPLAELRMNLAAANRRMQAQDANERLLPALVRTIPHLLRRQVTRARSEFRSILNRDRPSAPNAYHIWRENRKLTTEDRAQQTQWAAGLTDPRLLSILIPIYNPASDWLKRCIDSVLDQTYPHWEICAVDDGSTSPHVRPMLEEYARLDSRIKTQFREQNGGISAATNTALQLARGSHIVLLDHDDEFAPHALYAIARELVRDPHLDMIYSDEDKIAENGQHVEPFFKPDWSPDYLLSCMYTAHAAVYRTRIACDAGGFRSEFDGSQDYDFVLRISEVVPESKIHHIPDVLYHWRMLPTSTASSVHAKPQSWEAARRAVADHLHRRGLAASVEPGPSHGLHHVRYDLPGNPLVSIIIPTGCKRVKPADGETWFVLRCLQSIRKMASYSNLEIIVLDDTVMPVELAAQLDLLKVRRLSFDQPFNLSNKMNLGAAVSKGEYLLFLNDDTEIRSGDFVEEMLSLAQLPSVGAVGVKLVFPDGSLQHAGVIVLDGRPCHAFENYPGNHHGYFGSSCVIRNWIGVTGACMMSKRSAFEAIAGFNPAFPMNYNDIDFCLRLREIGLRSVCTPHAELMHHSSASSDGHFSHETLDFHARWMPKLQSDPFYNPNLSTRASDFRLNT